MLICAFLQVQGEQCHLFMKFQPQIATDKNFILIKNIEIILYSTENLLRLK